MGFDRHLVKCTHCYRVVQDSLTALKFLRALHVSVSLSPNLDNHRFFTVVIILPLTESYIVESYGMQNFCGT